MIAVMSFLLEHISAVPASGRGGFATAVVIFLKKSFQEDVIGVGWTLGYCELFDH